MNTLKPNQIKAATLLVAGKSAKDVASAISCTAETISHRKKNPNFVHYLNMLKMEFLIEYDTI